MSTSAPGPLDGVWELVRAEMNGEAAPELLAMKTQMELVSGNYRVRFDGEIADRGTFELGEAPEVQTLLLRGLEGPNADRTIPCIYQRVGDRLRVCYGLDGIVPTKFETAVGQQRYLASFRFKGW